MNAPAEQPWYHAGLRFTCTQCGDCCTGAPGFVWVSDDEIAALAEAVGETPETFRDVHTKMTTRGRSLRERANGDCIFYDRERGCTVYGVRPRQCRTWPFWASNLATPRDWAKTCKHCPGSGAGELISSDEITRRLAVIRI